MSCGSSSQTMTSPAGARCALQVQSESVSFAPEGGGGQLRITTARECTWTVRSEAAWLGLSPPAAGQGEGTVQFTVSPNADPSSRSGSIGVNDQQLQVSQAGSPCDLRVSPTHESVEPGGGERTVRVTASSDQCAWTASSSVAWIEILSGREGRGAGTVTFRVHTTDDPRSGVVMVAGQAVHVTVSALPPTPSACPPPVAEPAAFTMTAAGGPGTIAIRTGDGCGWSAQSTVPWIAVTGQSGSGPGEVRFAVAPSDDARTGAVRIGTAEVVVTQHAAPCSFAVTPGAASAPAQGSSGTIQVTAPAACAWTARSSASWVGVAEPGGTGSRSIGFLVAANNGPPRAATLTVAGHAIAVTQATGCTYTLSAVPDLPAAGGNAVVGVTAGDGCAWSAASAAPWLSVSPRSGAGSAQVQLTATPNTGPPRTTTVTIAGLTEAITQASPCTWSFAPSSIEIEAGGGFGTVLVLVTGACTWTAVSQAPWVTLVLAEGSGNGMVQMHIAPNAGPARSGIVTIGGVPYTIMQRAP